MIRVEVYIPKWNYLVHCFFEVSIEYMDDIMALLLGMNIEPDNARRIHSILSRNELNTGFCYTNEIIREAVIVISKTSSAEEFVNSFSHEVYHLASFIGKQFNLDPVGEDNAYLVGEITNDVFPYIKHLMCDCCRRKIMYN